MNTISPCPNWKYDVNVVIIISEFWTGILAFDQISHRKFSNEFLKCWRIFQNVANSEQGYLRAQKIFFDEYFFILLVLIWSCVFRGQIGILVTTIWDISDLLSWIFGDFKIPEIFMKFPDFEGKTTAKTHSNHHKINVFDVSRLRKWFPTILGVFPDSLAPEKHGWNRKSRFRASRST